MEEKVEDQFGKLLKLGFLKKVINPSEDKTLLFALHNRYYTEGVNTHELFSTIRSYKSVYDSILIEPKKIQVQYQEKRKKEDDEIGEEKKEEKPIEQDQIQKEEPEDRMLEPSGIYLRKSSDKGKVDSKLDSEEYMEHLRMLIEANFNVQDIIFKNTKNKPDAFKNFELMTYQAKYHFNVLECLSTFSDPYLHKVLSSVEKDKPFNKLRKEDPKMNDVEILKEDEKVCREITEQYKIDNHSFANNILQELNSSTSIRDGFIRELKNISVLDIRSLTNEEEDYPLSEKFNLTMSNNLKKYPKEAVFDYYGSRIALYFAFLCFYRDKMVKISVLGSIVALFIILQWLSQAQFIEGNQGAVFQELYQILNTIFCFFIPFWCISFILRWENYEKEFSIRFGQSNNEESFQIRTEFKGVQLRNLEDDRLNNEDIPIRKKKSVNCLTLISFILYIALSGVSCFYLLQYTRKAYRTNLIDLFGLPSPAEYGEQVVTVTSSESDIDGSGSQTSTGGTFDKEKTYTCIPFCNPNFPSCSQSDLKCAQCDSDCPIKEEFEVNGHPRFFKGVDGRPVPYPQPDYKEMFFNLNEAVFTFFEFLRIMLFEFVFMRIIQKLIKWENLKFKEQHEDSLIIYLGLFSIINNNLKILFVTVDILGSDDVIYYDTSSYKVFSATTSRICLRGSCSSELSKYFALLCLYHFVWVIGIKFIFLGIVSKVRIAFKKTLQPKVDYSKVKVMSVLKSSMMRGESRKIFKEDMESSPMRIGKFMEAMGIKRKETEEEDEDPIKEKLEMQKKQIKECVETFYKDPALLYDNINKEIEYQYLYKESADSEGDFDKETLDYLTLFNTFCMTSIFGGLFPISFMICWAIATTENYIDKNNLIYSSKRPLPKPASTIGSWLFLMRLVSLLSVTSNCYFVSMILFEFQSITTKFVFFLFFLILIFTMVNVFNDFLGGVSESVEVLVERSKFIHGYLFTKTKESVSNRIRFIFKTDFKVFGEVVVGRGKKIDVAELSKEQNEERETIQKEKKTMKKIAKVASSNLHSVGMRGFDEAGKIGQGEKLDEGQANQGNFEKLNKDNDNSMMNNPNPVKATSGMIDPIQISADRSRLDGHVEQIPLSNNK